MDYVKGWGKLKSATEVEVTGAGGVSTTVTAKSIIIATGSEVTPLPGVPVDERRCVVPYKGTGWTVGCPCRAAAFHGSAVSRAFRALPSHAPVCPQHCVFHRRTQPRQGARHHGGDWGRLHWPGAWVR